MSFASDNGFFFIFGSSHFTLLVYYTSTPPQNKRKLCFTLVLCSIREISLPRNLFREELWLLLMRATDWLSCEKPNRPPSEVTNSNSLDTYLPLSVYSVATLAFSWHHITSTTTNWSKYKVEKVFEYALASGTNNMESPLNHWYNVKCCVTLYDVEIRASHSTVHPNYCPHHVWVSLRFITRTL